MFQTSFSIIFIFRFKQVLTQLRESADRSTMRRFQHYGRSSELNRQSSYPGAPVRGRDVKRATITGLLIALSIYIIVTLITMGVLPHGKLVGSEKPFVDVLYAIVGNAGSVIMAILAILCLFGTMLGWILLGSEVPYQAAKSGDFPALLQKRINRATRLCR